MEEKENQVLNNKGCLESDSDKIKKAKEYMEDAYNYFGILRSVTPRNVLTGLKEILGE